MSETYGRDLGAQGGPGRPGADRGHVRCAGEGEQVVLTFRHDAALVGEAKAIGGRRFDWDTKTSIYPFGKLPQVVALADAHGIEVAPQVRTLVPSAVTWAGREMMSPGRALRQAAHLYLGHGLQPVPAWAVGDDGVCRCPRGTACARPGKHPRSVHAGPGPRDYSWRPLACSTHEEVERRFASDGRYAIANLMLAIPPGMLVIDQDNDDGGRQAIAGLAERLGELPATLCHDTPHGRHLIYRTPAGWTTRAWVGKDARNPLPAGVDLRVPGQVLMAPPSRVPGTHGPTRYGPASGPAAADLPGNYIAAWAPPRERARLVRPVTAAQPGRADAAASYVHARIIGISQDLAAREPGGRNAAIYTAALKVGSTLGAARITPGVGHAAVAWTDERVENVLMTAAEQNGYVADHSAAAGHAAIKSGLRNGLRNPRPLPDLGRRQTTRDPGPHGRDTRPELGAGGATPRASVARGRPASDEPTAVRAYPLAATCGTEPALGQILASKDAESVQGEGPVAGQWPDARVGDRPEAGAEGPAIGARCPSGGHPDWRDCPDGIQDQAWQPKVTQPDGPLVRPAEADEPQATS